ncbi:LysE family translocator [Aestuariirhabdus sp. LZHN29]|uniref:LysE family translocator n=1 Tax=Aestuariirhabdus sp. LZHN29 TaxID=3417462 RepID=UPI003CF948AE
MDATILWFYLLGLVVVYLLPGPDMLLLLATSAANGRAPARAMALGFALSRGLHALFAALGISALLATSPLAFELLRYFGVGYLLFLAWQSLRSKQRSPAPTGGCGAEVAGFRKGLLTNLLNPKALLFCGVFLPQFIVPGGSSLGQQFLLLGALLVIVGLAFDLLYIALARRVAERWRGSEGQGTLLRWLFSSLFVGLALRLLLIEGS